MGVVGSIEIVVVGMGMRVVGGSAMGMRVVGGSTMGMRVVGVSSPTGAADSISAGAAAWISVAGLPAHSVNGAVSSPFIRKASAPITVPGAVEIGRAHV